MGGMIQPAALVCNRTVNGARHLCRFNEDQFLIFKARGALKQ
jgi:hypothetical protein